MNELTIPDASQMRGEIKAFMSERDILIARTAAISVITCIEELEAANDFLTSVLVPLHKRIEDKRKQYSLVLRRLATQWDGEFKPTEEAVAGMIRGLKGSIITYTREQEEKARKAQEELDRQMEEERKKGEDVEWTAVSIVPVTPRTIRGETGTSTVKEVPYVEIYDESLLERKYLMTNVPLVNRDVKAGIKVNGARLAYRDEVATRVKK